MAILLLRSNSLRLGNMSHLRSNIPTDFSTPSPDISGSGRQINAPQFLSLTFSSSTTMQVTRVFNGSRIIAVKQNQRLIKTVYQFLQDSNMRISLDGVLTQVGRHRATHVRRTQYPLKQQSLPHARLIHNLCARISHTTSAYLVSQIPEQPLSRREIEGGLECGQR